MASVPAPDWPQLDKPAFGEPCNQCGLCCLTEQCPISLAVFGEQAVCPALRPDAPRMECGLMLDAAMYAQTPKWSGDALTEAFGLMLAKGIGCDAGRDYDPEADERMRLAAIAAAELASPDARVLFRVIAEPRDA